MIVLCAGVGIPNFREVLGKTSCTPQVDQLRAVLPMPALMQIADVILSSRSNTFTDRVLLTPGSCFVGARPRTQAAEIAQSLHLFIDRSLDDFSSGGIAQTDIETFFVTISCVGVVRWFLSNRFDPGCAAAALSIQMLPLANLNSGAMAVEIKNRSGGGLTGSRVAGALGRIPVEQTMS